MELTDDDLPGHLEVLAAEAWVASSSGMSVIAMGCLTSWNDIRERPSSFFNRSASTFIGPGDGAEPGAGCGKAVDIAVWKVMCPSTFCIT